MFNASSSQHMIIARDEEAAGGRNCQFLGLGAGAADLDTVISGELAILKRLAGIGQIAE